MGQVGWEKGVAGKAAVSLSLRKGFMEEFWQNTENSHPLLSVLNIGGLHEIFLRMGSIALHKKSLNTNEVEGRDG